MSSIAEALQQPSHPPRSADQGGYAECVRDRIEQRLRKTRRTVPIGLYWGGLLVTAVLFSALGLWLWEVDIGMPYFMLGLMMALFLTVVVPVVLHSLRLVRRTRHVLDAMEQQPHRPMCRICPSCGGDPFGADRCCQAMSCSWSDRELDHHWSDFAFLGSTAGQIKRGDKEERVLSNPVVDLIPEFLRQTFRIKWICWSMSVCGIVLLLFGAAVFGMDAVSTAFSPLLILYCFTNAVCLESSTRPQCVHCAHLLQPKGRFDAYDVCPECGKFVHKVGFAFYKIGARKLDLLTSSLRRPFFPLMLVIFLACVSSMFFRSTRLPFVPVLPTSWLITLASMDDRPYPIWTELLTRTWTPEQSRDLSLKLKAVMENHRSTRSYLLAGHPAYTSFQSGTWPAPLSSSEIGELIGSDEVFQLHALEPGAPGTPRAFQIGCTSAQPILDRYDTYLVYDTIARDDGDPIPVPQTLEPISLGRLQYLPAFGTKPDYYDGVHEVKIGIPDRGPANVKVAVWVFRDPAMLLDTVTRDGKGELVFPPTTLWAGRIVLEHELASPKQVVDALSDQPRP